MLVGAISDRIDGGYIGLSIGLAISGVFGLVASVVWWSTARHVDADTQMAIAASA